jgi:hypothetical protein
MYAHLEKSGEERTVNNLTQSLVTPHGLRFISNQYIICYQMEQVTHVTFKEVSNALRFSAWSATIRVGVLRGITQAVK